jgi:predicted O-linked N-acetylglucosamine transferase (SPINDLY family)
MRERLRTSPLMDARGFTASVEEAYCAMWNTAIAAEKQTLCANMEGHR